MELAGLEPTPGWDGVVEQLLVVAREELGGRVVLERDAPGGSDDVEPAGVAVPVHGARGRRYGVLRVRNATDSLNPQEERVARVLARLIGERLDQSGLVSAAWDRRVDRIKSVLETGTLGMVYQPIANLRTGEVVGVEALSRFPDPPRLPPDRWFADAASVGLGPELEVLAISTALVSFETIPSDVYLSLNVSPATVLTPALARALETAPLDRVVFEITEHAQVSDYTALNSALRPLRARGLRLAVDDAGAGFASLRHILRIAPDIIKLDISLTHDIDHNAVLRALSYSLAAFASAIDATVVAEGIEREEELDALKFLGVTYGQGYYLCYPGALPSTEELTVSLVTPSIAG